jgi:DNA polymerase (family X)
MTIRGDAGGDGGRRERAGTAAPRSSTNEAVAEWLRRAATLLDQQGANPFRAAAYRRAADTVEELRQDVGSIVDAAGVAGLDRLPNVGPGIAAAIQEMVRTGRWSLLERLQGTAEPERLFQSIPGVGPALAKRIHDTLEVESLEGLEMAAHDGALESVPGISHRRAAAIRASLQAMLGRPLPRPRRLGGEGPPVELVLAVDREYREQVDADALPKIAPRRFNPDHVPWLPILHTEQGGWRFTALFSNSARAHDLDRTRDWVIVYCYDDDHLEAQYTVVTELRGELAGRRVVRAREEECRRWYAAAEDSS